MNETNPSPQPPKKPGWFRSPSKPSEPSPDSTAETGSAGKASTTPLDGKAASQSPVAKSSRTAKGARSATAAVFAVPQFFLTLKPDANLLQTSRSLKERLLHEWETNREGLLTSLGLHLGLLILFALYVLPSGGNGRPAIINVGWSPRPSAAAQEAMSQPVKIDTQLGPVKTTVGLSDAKAKEKTQPSEVKQGVGSSVTKPAPVGGATLAARTGEGRAAIWQDLNTDKSERGIGAGLAWLTRQQEKGGNWKLHEGYPDAGDRTIRTDTGATALALLALLGDGNTTTEGTHSKAVAKGISWLKSIQKANGDFHDHEELGRTTAFYAHSQATIAMCEAYALARDPSLKASCERAIKFLMDSQHPQNGGWRYQPQTGSSMGDLSVTGWALMALHSARMAKINVPIDNFERATLFLDSVSEQNGARYKYQPNDPLEKVSPAMTAEGLLCRQWLGWERNHPAQVDAIAYLLSDEHRPNLAPGRRNAYAWYYAAQVLHNVGGPQWAAWYQHTSQLLLSQQVVGGGEVGGSWHPRRPPGANEEYAEKGGRLYLTAMCLLVLETPVRHTAIYKSEKE